MDGIDEASRVRSAHEIERRIADIGIVHPDVQGAVYARGLLALDEAAAVARHAHQRLLLDPMQEGARSVGSACSGSTRR